MSGDCLFDAEKYGKHQEKNGEKIINRNTRAHMKVTLFRFAICYMYPINNCSCLK